MLNRDREMQVNDKININSVLLFNVVVLGGEKGSLLTWMGAYSFSTLVSLSSSTPVSLSPSTLVSLSPSTLVSLSSSTLVFLSSSTLVSLSPSHLAENPGCVPSWQNHHRPDNDQKY